MICERDLTSSCVMSEGDRVLKHQFLSQVFRALPFPFIHSSFHPLFLRPFRRCWLGSLLPYIWSVT